MESTKGPVMAKKWSLKIIPKAGGLLGVGEVLTLQAWWPELGVPSAHRMW